MAVELYYNNWVDAGGHFQQTVYRYDPGGLVPNPEGLNPYMRGLSNAGFVGYSHGASQSDQNQEGTAAVFPAVNQVAQLTFADSSGSVAEIYIPAPVSSMFLSDGITVDTSNLAVSIFINTVCIGSNRLYTAAGGVVTTYLSGFLRAKGSY